MQSPAGSHSEKGWWVTFRELAMCNVRLRGEEGVPVRRGGSRCAGTAASAPGADEAQKLIGPTLDR